jgi:hypothetical protein
MTSFFCFLLAWRQRRHGGGCISTTWARVSFISWDVVLVIITRKSVPTGGENRGGRDVIIAGAKTRICGQNAGPHGLQLLFEMKLRLQNGLAMWVHLWDSFGTVLIILQVTESHVASLFVIDTFYDCFWVLCSVIVNISFTNELSGVLVNCHFNIRRNDTAPVMKQMIRLFGGSLASVRW